MTKSNPIIKERPTRNLNGDLHTRHYYWCPGCDALHGIAVNGKQDNGASWTFTGTLEKPTYSPSQLSTYDRWKGHDQPPEKFVCHTFIREGMIQFLDDCTHHLKGQTVPLPPLPDWMFYEEKEPDKEEDNS